MKMAEMLCMNYYPVCEFLWIKLIYPEKIHLFFPFFWVTYIIEQIHYIYQNYWALGFNLLVGTPAFLVESRLHTEGEKEKRRIMQYTSRISVTHSTSKTTFNPIVVALEPYSSYFICGEDLDVTNQNN